MKSDYLYQAATLCALSLLYLPTQAQYSLQNLTVEYADRPMGIEAVAPRFGRQMQVESGEQGLSQKTYCYDDDRRHSHPSPRSPRLGALTAAR